MKKVSLCLLIVILATALYGCSSTNSGGSPDYKLVWQNNERATYNLMVNDDFLSVVEYTIERVDGSLYKVDSYTEVQGGVTNTGAYVDTSSFLPVSNYFIQVPPPEATREKTEIKGEYKDNLLKLNIDHEGKVQDIDVKLPNNVVDNEAVLMMVRNLPLKEDFQQSINIAIPSSAQVAPYLVKVVDIETIEVPYGEFEAFKVMFRYSGKGSVPDMFAWYTTDENKIMLKYTNQNARFELVDFK